MRILFATAALLCCALLGVSSAAASGFELTRIGGEFGHAAAPNPLAVYYNPAALAKTRKVHLVGEVTLVMHSAEYRRTESTTPEPADAEGANLGTAKLFDVAVAPTLAGSMRFGDFAVGLGFFAPMSGAMSYQRNDAFAGNTKYPGAEDGAARWHMIEGEQQVLYASASAAYTIRAIGLSLGLGANLNYARVRLLRARTGIGDDDLSSEGRVDLDVSGLGGSFSAGLLWEILAEKLWFGLSYQAPPGLYDGITLTGDLRTYLGTGSTKSASDMQLTLPDVVRWALRYREQRYELRLFGDISRWSTMERQCVVAADAPCDVNADGSEASGAEVLSNHVRKWKNTFGVRAGGSYWFTPELEGFVGIGYDGNAIRKGYLEPSIIDGHDISGSLGARLALGSHLALALTYTHVHMLSRTVTRSRLYDLSRPSKLPSGAGEYKQWLGMVHGFLEAYFD